MADNVGTPSKIAFGSGSDVSLINVVFATFLHVLRYSDCQTSVHVGFGVEIRHILVWITEVVEVFAGLPDLTHAYLTEDRRIECTHCFGQDRGDG